MKIRLFLVLLLLASGLQKIQAQRKDILLNNNWQFTPGYIVDNNVFERVDIPHTWNRIDALAGELDYFRGLGNYQKEVFIDQSWEGKRLFVKFDGVNTCANVFINGKHLGEHRGGYTAFIFEITDNVNYGSENQILVRVNNAPQLDVMPLVGDFNFYGGIYRDVHLLITGNACISPLDYASSGIYLRQKNISYSKADVEAFVHISNPSKESGFNLNIRVIENDHIKIEKTIPLSPEQKVAYVSFTIPKPRLWNGIKDPFLYAAEVDLVHDGEIIDKVIQPFGLRYYSIDADSGFYLNGEHLQLKGVCRHQDREGYGNALQAAHHREDMAIIKEMGANAIRLSHYPQSQYFVDLLDKNGFVTWMEIPFVGPGGYRDKGFVNQESFKENGKQQLREMIRQYYNHPSICFWGLFNELKQTGDDPIEYVNELNELAKKEDSTRITTAASFQEGDINMITDLIAWNKYYGWYGSNPKVIGEWADKQHEAFPILKIGISEYGAGASISQHEQPIKKPGPRSTWHPEEWQAYFHEEYWKAIDKRSFLWGTFIWNMFDFGAAHRTEGDRIGRNDKGLVTFDRKLKKDAFWFYKANWNQDEPFVYITDKRFEIRNDSITNIKVYSNCKEVELFINGKSLGTTNGEYGTFFWEHVPLKAGENEIKCINPDKRSKCSDMCFWTVRPLR